MEQKITIDNALEMTANILKGISVPVSMTDQIAVPIMNAVRNLEQCVTAIRNANAPNEEPEDKPELIPLEEIPEE